MRRDRIEKLREKYSEASIHMSLYATSLKE